MGKQIKYTIVLILSLAIFTTTVSAKKLSKPNLVKQINQKHKLKLKASKAKLKKNISVKLTMIADTPSLKDRYNLSFEGKTYQALFTKEPDYKLLNKMIQADVLFYKDFCIVKSLRAENNTKFSTTGNPIFTGEKKFLVMMLNYTDLKMGPGDEARIKELMFSTQPVSSFENLSPHPSVKTFYQKESKGLIDISGDVVQVELNEQSSAQPCTFGAGAPYIIAAKAQAQAMGYNISDYDYYLLITPISHICGAYGGAAEGGGQHALISLSVSTKTFAHEIGHLFGLGHSGAVFTVVPNDEVYGDYTSVMGRGYSLSPSARIQLGWDLKGDQLEVLDLNTEYLDETIVLNNLSSDRGTRAIEIQTNLNSSTESEIKTDKIYISYRTQNPNPSLNEAKFYDSIDIQYKQVGRLSIDTQIVKKLDLNNGQTSFIDHIYGYQLTVNHFDKNSTSINIQKIDPIQLNIKQTDNYQVGDLVNKENNLIMSVEVTNTSTEKLKIQDLTFIGYVLKNPHEEVDYKSELEFNLKANKGTNVAISETAHILGDDSLSFKLPIQTILAGESIEFELRVEDPDNLIKEDVEFRFFIFTNPLTSRAGLKVEDQNSNYIPFAIEDRHKRISTELHYQTEADNQELNILQTIDLNADNVLNNTEFYKLTQGLMNAFRKYNHLYDINQDQVINQNDLDLIKDFLIERFPNAINTVSALSKINSNNDGLISTTETRDYINSIEVYWNTDNITYDLNEDGLVNYSDYIYIDMIDTLFAVYVKQPDLPSFIDINADNKLDMAEAIVFMFKYLTNNEFAASIDRASLANLSATNLQLLNLASNSFKTIDTDNSLSISEEELYSALKNIVNAVSAYDESADLNKDQLINNHDLHILGSFAKLIDDSLIESFNKFDMNSNLLIDTNELINLVLKSNSSSDSDSIKVASLNSNYTLITKAISVIDFNRNTVIDDDEVTRIILELRREDHRRYYRYYRKYDLNTNYTIDDSDKDIFLTICAINENFNSYQKAIETVDSLSHYMFGKGYILDYNANANVSEVVSSYMRYKKLVFSNQYDPSYDFNNDNKIDETDKAYLLKIYEQSRYRVGIAYVNALEKFDVNKNASIDYGEAKNAYRSTLNAYQAYRKTRIADANYDFNNDNRIDYHDFRAAIMVRSTYSLR